MMSIPSRARSRALRFVVEELEPRCLLTGFDPTVAEQVFLERLNDARANPTAYGNSIGVNLSYAAPAAPLAFNTLLIQAARGHSQDMTDRNYFSHNTPEGLTPGDRMAAVGFPWIAWGESIAGGYATPEQALAGLIIDAGVPDLGHRNQLLAIDSVYWDQRQVGIGVVQGGTGSYVNYYTIDTAATADSRSFLTGVVFNDANGNGLYQAGEGLAGVTITVAGVGSTTTFATGGYSFQLSPGTYTVTAAGGGLSRPITKTVTIGAANARVNFTPQDLTWGVITSTTIATGSAPGGPPLVQMYDGASGAFQFGFYAYNPSFLGGVHVVLADIFGRGVPQVITAPGPAGGPDIRIFDGTTGQLIEEFMAYDASFRGGVNIAVGDVNRDGIPDLVTAAASGNPHVRVFNGQAFANGTFNPANPSASLLAQWFAYGLQFNVGANVAVGDISGNGYADIVTGASIGNPHVKVYEGRDIATGAFNPANPDGSLLAQWFPYALQFNVGVNVAVGRITADGYADIVTGATIGNPDVRVYRSRDIVTGVFDGDNPAASELAQFFAYGLQANIGVNLAVADLNGDGYADIITGASTGGPHVKVYDGQAIAAGTFDSANPDADLLDQFFAGSLQGVGVTVGGQ
jgi:hypothetical protein